jgi:hypothetical protein
VENPPTLHGKGYLLHFSFFKIWVENPPTLHDKGGPALVFVCLFVTPIYPFKVHAMCINELEAFLEFQAKICENH